jgi:hypothetical protein
MVKIDRNCVYVPSQYAGSLITYVETGGNSNGGSSIGKAVSCPDGGAWVNHTRNSPTSGKVYDIYCWSPRELIGTATAE